MIGQCETSKEGSLGVSILLHDACSHHRQNGNYPSPPHIAGYLDTGHAVRDCISRRQRYANRRPAWPSVDISVVKVGSSMLTRLLPWMLQPEIEDPLVLLLQGSLSPFNFTDQSIPQDLLIRVLGLLECVNEFLVLGKGNGNTLEVSSELSLGESLFLSSSSLAEAASNSFLCLTAFAVARAFFVFRAFFILALGSGGIGGMRGLVRRSSLLSSRDGLHGHIPVPQYAIRSQQHAIEIHARLQRG